jgi:hypothetical protein
MKMMNYSTFSNAPYDLTSLILQTYYRFQLPFVVCHVAKMLGLRFYNVVAWDAIFLGYGKFGQGQKVLQCFEYGVHNHIMSFSWYLYLLMIHKVDKCK